MFVEDKASGETPSLDGFIDFCSSKDPSEKYHWPDSRECACGQYLKFIGQFTPQWVGSSDLMGKLDRIASGVLKEHDLWSHGCRESSWTFGLCAERAKMWAKVLA